MDLSTILGLCIALLALFTSLFIEGGNLASLVNISALVLVLGGTIGATVISFPMRDIVKLPALLLQAFMGKDPDMDAAVAALVRYAELARREGILSLENRVNEVSSNLLRHGLSLAVDGIDPEQAAVILNAESNQSRSQFLLGANMLETAGGYAPTMGIIGTVMGLVHVLGNISDTGKLAESIAVAFLATFYGIATANLFWLPIASKLREKARQEKLRDDVIIEGIIAIIEGINFRLIEERLLAISGIKSSSLEAEEQAKHAEQRGQEKVPDEGENVEAATK